MCARSRVAPLERVGDRASRDRAARRRRHVPAARSSRPAPARRRERNSPGSSRSPMRMPVRSARSPYAGPMPRLVVPMPPSVAARLARAVEGHVVGHDHVRGAADAELVGRDAALGEHLHLGDQRARIDDHAGADDRRDVRVEHAARHEVELEDLLADDDRVAGVVAALVADDDRHRLRQQVGCLALALVAPLQAADDCRRHLVRASLGGNCPGAG